ncbi:MAG: M14 family zinc carboxypeptidase [Hungatella sp.]
MRRNEIVISLLLCLFFARSMATSTAFAQEIGPGIPGSGKAQVASASTAWQYDAAKIHLEGEIHDLEVQTPIVPTPDKYSYDQMVTDIHNLSAAYPDILTVNIIGTSLDGRDIYELILGNPHADRHILIQAGIHAREYMTPLLAMKQAEQALDVYYRGSYHGKSIAEMFSQAAIHYVPMSNPDGTTLSQFGLSGIRSEALKQEILRCYDTDRLHGRASANLNAYLSRWKSNARGLDLNRSFDAGWAEIPTYTPYPSYDSYKGTSPASEPETQALVNLVNQRQWAATISYHSMGQLIYWDYPVNHCRDASRHLGNLISAATGYHMSSAVSGGGFKDWMQSNAANFAPSVTLEVGQNPCPLSMSEYPTIWAQNRSVWAIALEFALAQGHG